MWCRWQLQLLHHVDADSVDRTLMVDRRGASSLSHFTVGMKKLGTVAFLFQHEIAGQPPVVLPWWWRAGHLVRRAVSNAVLWYHMMWSDPRLEVRSTSMNKVMMDFLDQFVVVFVDDILIYSRIQEEHEQHLRWVLTRLKEHKLYAKFSKWVLDKTDRFPRSYYHRRIKMDLEKVRAILEWKTPTMWKNSEAFRV